jgi:deoxyribodipyrimidine photolyase
MYHNYSNIDIIINNKYEKINKFILNSMHNYYDIIIEQLKDKYPSLNKNKQKVFDSQLTIFTCKNSLIEKYEKTTICFNYEYEYYYDIYDKIINTYKINPNVFDNIDVLKFCVSNKIAVYNKNGSMYQQDLLFQNILKLYYYRKYKLSEVSKKEDTFFKDYIIIEKEKIKNKT